MRQVHIKWVDSANLFGDRWGKLEDIDDEETLCETMGFLVKENDHSVYIAGSVATEEIGSVMQIPRVAIKEFKEISSGQVDIEAAEEAAIVEFRRPEPQLPGAG